MNPDCVGRDDDDGPDDLRDRDQRRPRQMTYVEGG